MSRRTLLALPVLEQLHGLEGGAAGHELVAQLRLVRRAVVDLVAGILGFVLGGGRRGQLFPRGPRRRELRSSLAGRVSETYGIRTYSLNWLGTPVIWNGITP